MISSVKIRNFQSLEDTGLELGVLTVILGQNDVGKSALFRAIKAAVEGGATGSSFITYGHNQTRVEIIFRGEGETGSLHTLVWEKGKDVNRYALDDQVFEKVGRSIPPDLEQYIAMGNIDFGKDLTLNLNFADQEDPPFLIPFPGGLSTAHVAKVLGDLTNLNVLYRSVSLAETRRRQSKEMLGIRQNDLAVSEALLREFEGLDLKLEALEECTTREAAALEALRNIRVLESLRNERENFRQRHVSLATLEAQIGPDYSDLVEELEAKVQELQTLDKAAWHIKEGEQRLQLFDSGIATALENERLARAQYEQYMMDLEVCPLCERPMDHDHFLHTHDNTAPTAQVT
jgi:hypothetical protein